MADPGVQAPMHKNPTATLTRIHNYYTSTRFQDVNLVGKLYPYVKPIDSITHWALPGGEGAWTGYTFNEVIGQDFQPAKIGDSFGPTWSTHWFKLDFTLPQGLSNVDVFLRWDSSTEATLWDQEGKVIQGLASNNQRTDALISRDLNGGGESRTYYVEMVASRMFGASPDSDNISPPDPDLYFTLKTCEVIARDRSVYKISTDLDVLYQIADNLMPNDPRGYMAEHSANQIVNSIIKDDWEGANTVADQYFQKGNGMRSHTLAAIGNCHIDSAWLWPYSETKRKVARSYSSQVRLINEHSDYLFVASQAQQWAWCKEYYPELFERIRARVSLKRFLPVGNTWVEMDGNIPSGESFIRQFFYGAKFYFEEFQYICKEFWLPDTFGYNGQIPGLMKHCGLGRFLTQKMSWSLVNKFPHNSFKWEGIDGSTVLAHFPPGDSYNMHCNVQEALYSVSNMKDKGRVSTSAYLFGFGDGGGGPTEDMLQRRKRLADTDGIPKMKLMSPDQLFEQLEKEMHNMQRWVGELFLELHNGTYTSQSAMKRLCRQSEFRIRDSEFMLSATLAPTVTSSQNFLQKSMADLEEAWKKICLNQFHDVLPGSGIGIIYPQAEEYYDQAMKTSDRVLHESADILFGTDTTTTATVLNTLQWPRTEVVEVISRNKALVEEADKASGFTIISTLNKQEHSSSNSGKTISAPVNASPLVKLPNTEVRKPRTVKGKGQQSRLSSYALVHVPSFGYSEVEDQEPTNPASINAEADGSYTLTNGLLTATIAPCGQITSLKVHDDDRDLLQSDSSDAITANKIVIYDDEPMYWDAWDVPDYHLETEKVLNQDLNSSDSTVTSPVAIVESGPLLCRLTWSLDVGVRSSMTQDIVIKADTPYLIFETAIDWHEDHKIVKASFDTNLLSRNTAFDIQFGFIERANHMNTSWDTARYEVPGHKWADLSEPDRGLAILNDSKFGWESRGSNITLSLLKAPKAPDDMCDMKNHFIKYAVMPHQGSLQDAEVMRRSYEFNNPLRFLEVATSHVTTNPTWSFCEVVVGGGIVLHTIKPADLDKADGANAGKIILRFFECNGSRSKASFRLNLVAAKMEVCNGMEEVEPDSSIDFTPDYAKKTTDFEITLSPFKIYALMVTLEDANKLGNYGCKPF